MPKSILITGAGSGFGKGAAIALAERGHRVIAATETDEQATALAAEHPELEVVRIDITSDDIDRVSDYEIDVLFNNAGIGQTGPLADVPMDRFRRTFEVNVFGTMAITRAVLAGMLQRNSGRVVITSSIMGVRTAPIFGPYAMTKHALEAMGKTMRAELAPHGIDVCVLNPGPFLTGFNEQIVATMWEWYDDDTLTAENRGMYEAMRDAMSGDGGQMDPAQVIERMVELAEAGETEVNNFVPSDIIATLETPRPT